MNRRTILWALVFLLAGVALAAGWMPGLEDTATGPRVGLTAALLMLGVVLAGASFAGVIQRRTAKLDAKGGCPVGARCACGHFNLKPRATCRQCGAATLYATSAN